MEEGRELDTLIATEIMGFGFLEGDAYEKWIEFGPKPYSTDIAAAWEVIDKMYETGHGFCIERAHSADKWTVHFLPNRPPKMHFVHFIEDMERISYQAESLPHAICLAALKALEG